MSDKRVLNHDPMTGMTEYFIMGDDKSFTIQYEQDQRVVQAILDDASRSRNMQSKSDRWGDGKHIAVIPAEVYTKMLAEGWAHDTPKLRQWLNDRNNFKCRTWEGRV